MTKSALAESAAESVLVKTRRGCEPYTKGGQAGTADARPLPILCPAYPGEPGWRPITCYVLTHMGVPPDREPMPGEPARLPDGVESHEGEGET